MLPAEVQSQLVQVAREAIRSAYAPYSRIRVGAALLTQKGNLYTGGNVENASYGLTMCAERTAIFTAVAREGPEMRILALAVVNEGGLPFPPCGACRQVILEFGPGAVVLFEEIGGWCLKHIEELLPEGFALPQRKD